MAKLIKPMRRTIMIGCIVAAGCVSVLPEPKAPEAIYTIRAAPGLADVPLHGTVIVNEPSGPRLVAGRQILFEQADGSFALLSGREWTDNAAVMMQYALVDTLNDGEGSGVALAAGTGARGDVEVSWRLQSFAVRKGEAEASVSVTVLAGPRRAALWQREYSAIVPIQGDREVQALAEAGRNVVGQAARDVRALMAERNAAAGDVASVSEPRPTAAPDAAQ